MEAWKRDKNGAAVSLRKDMGDDILLGACDWLGDAV